jgi:hypothetical protein
MENYATCVEIYKIRANSVDIIDVRGCNFSIAFAHLTGCHCCHFLPVSTIRKLTLVRNSVWIEKLIWMNRLGETLEKNIHFHQATFSLASTRAMPFRRIVITYCYVLWNFYESLATCTYFWANHLQNST